MASRIVAVIDDHAAVRDALGEMLSVFGFDVERHGSALAFLASPGLHLTGCIVADVRMPGMDGIQLVRELQDRGMPVPVLLISGHADVAMAVAAIKAGAQDFIEKPVDDVQLVAAINRALADAGPVDDLLALPNALRERFSRLTPRQIEVFDLVAQGYSSQTISGRMGISARTVESYRAGIMEKMQAESVAVLVRQAIRLGRIDP
jgi:two-component system response regulator FixJ